MNATPRFAAALVAWTTLVATGCECQSRKQPGQELPDIPDIPPRAERRTPGEPIPHDGKKLTPAQREQAEALATLVTTYYPVWEPQRETVNDYLERYEDAPETRRLHALIRDRVENDGTWRACLAEIQHALKGKFFVRNGTPPRFYIPSFQVVMHGNHPRGQLTMVFCLSVLAPLFEYYERLRNPATRRVETSMIPSRETAPIANLVRDIIAKYYPSYRELPPAIGSTQVPNIITIDIGSPDEIVTVDLTLAELLFEDHRSW